jgi:hypothetical protein
VPSFEANGMMLLLSGSSMSVLAVLFHSNLPVGYARRVQRYTDSYLHLAASSQKPQMVEAPTSSSGPPVQTERGGGKLAPLDSLLFVLSPVPAYTDRALPSKGPLALSHTSWLGTVAMATEGTTTQNIGKDMGAQFEAVMPIEESVRSVEKDMWNILHVEPDWRYFSEDLEVVDPSGNRLGFQLVKKFLLLVRKFRRRFVSKEDNSLQCEGIDSATYEMHCSGGILLQGKGLPIPKLGIFTLEIEVSCRVLFNSKGKVSTLMIDSLLFNGRKLNLPTISNPSRLSPRDTIALLAWTRKAILGC